MLYNISIKAKEIKLMKSSYQSRALKTFKLLLPYITNCHTVDRYAEAVRKFNQEHRNYNIKFAHGATRVCFICADYAIKKGLW